MIIIKIYFLHIKNNLTNSIFISTRIKKKEKSQNKKKRKQTLECLENV